ncbi:MAG TPA: helix-turn-helix domain-containing protein [Solirubrobacteraceae bacterium]|nr:helix-turn-helix domain-containing protein [Solirubrobacteraceae bacterium]
MPRVSPEHLEARRRQILDAARRLFTANGFHATSMQDILAESELSAGAVYRYFPGKEAIVAAIAEQAIGDIRATFESDEEDRTILEILARALAALDKRAAANDVGRLALQVWAEAARSETLRLRIADAVLDAREAMRARIERQYGPDVDAEAIAAVTIALFPGYLHATVIVGDIDAERYLRGVEELSALIA